MMKKPFIGFVVSIILMLIVGILMLWSTGAYARDAHGDPVFFIKRQVIWLSVGIVACWGGACFDYHYWKRLWLPLFGFTCVLLGMVFLFPEVNGAQRWIKVGGFSMQPSELGKIAALAFLCSWFADREASAKTFLQGFIYPLAVVGVIVGLIAIEVDLGTASLIAATAMLTMFIAGANQFYLGLTALGGFAALITVAMAIPQRMARLTAFLDLEKFQDGAGYQQLMGLIALGSGGISGLGLGNGRQKMSFLPYAHTDFIFPMIGEEFGLIGTLVVVFTYVLMVVCGIAIAVNASDRFGSLFAFGLISILGIQAALNIAVTTALLPNKGIALPFISYGGSSLVFSMLIVGIIINIYRQGSTGKVISVKAPSSVSVMPRF